MSKTGIGSNKITSWIEGLGASGKSVVIRLFISVIGALLAAGLTCRVDAASGQLDTGFASALNGLVSACAVHPLTGKIIVGGGFSQAGGLAKQGIVALNSDGSVDTSFYVYPPLTGGVSCFAIQPDGRIVFAETFASVGGVVPCRLARMLTNGTIDASFPSTSFNDRIKSIAIQTGTGDPAEDGKILVGGDFTPYKSVSRFYLARFYSNGTLDGSFNPYPNGPVNVVAHQPGAVQNITIGGEFTFVAGATHYYFESLALNGTHNGVFVNSPDADSDVSAALRVGFDTIIGGVFTTIDGNFRMKLAGFDINGGVGSLGTVAPYLPATTAQVLALGGDYANLYVGGYFSFTHNSVSYQHIVRYNNSSQDLGFCAGAVNGTVQTLFVQSDGKILIGGTFTSVQGQTRNYLARLLP